MATAAPAIPAAGDCATDREAPPPWLGCAGAAAGCGAGRAAGAAATAPADPSAKAKGTGCPNVACSTWATNRTFSGFCTWLYTNCWLPSKVATMPPVAGL